MRALFDADVVVFRAGFAAEKNRWFLSVGGEAPEIISYKKDALLRLDELLPGKESRVEGEDYELWAEKYVEPLENALHLVKNIIEKALHNVECSDVDAKMFLSGPTNFRYEVATTRPYKGNRDKSHRPTHEKEIRKFIRSQWDTVVCDGIEADDGLGIHQTRYGPHDSVIISVDKDLDMIPGFKYNFVHDIHYDVSPSVAWKTFCLQLLTGDTTDNIPGLKGVGKSKAQKMLDGLPQEEWLEECARQYASKSGQKDWFTYMTEQAQLIWIMQKEGEMFTLPEELESLGGHSDGTVETSLFY